MENLTGLMGLGEAEAALEGLGSPALSPTTKTLKAAMDWLDLYLVPLLLAVGVLGNSLSFVVFLGTHLRRHSSNVYLASLAAADNAFLFCVFLSWGNKMGISLFFQPGWCQALVYLTYVSSFLSVWYVVAFTLERYILVRCPLRRRDSCSTRVAGVVALCLALLALLAYTFTLVMSGVVRLGDLQLCVPLPKYIDVVSTLNNVDTVVTLVIPTVLIIGCNIRITLLVGNFYRNHQAGTLQLGKWDFRGPPPLRYSSSAGRAQGAGRAQPRAPLAPVPGRAHMRVTRMLLMVSTVFLVCNLPSHAARTYALIRALIDPLYRPSPEFMLCQRFFQILYYTNFSVNFVLYSITGRSFRLGLRRMLTKLGDKARRVLWFWRWARQRECPPASPRLLSTRLNARPSARAGAAPRLSHSATKRLYPQRPEWGREPDSEEGEEEEASADTRQRQITAYRSET